MAQHAPNGQVPELPPSDGPKVNPSAMSVANAARVFTRLGGSQVTEEMLRAHIDAGAPTNRDDTLNLVHYAAWLVKEMTTSGA